MEEEFGGTAKPARWRCRMMQLIRTILLLTLAAAPSMLAAGKYFAYVGTYTRTDSKGIYFFQFDPATGEMSKPELAAEVENPSFLTIHPNRKFLSAVSELPNG